MSRIKKIDRKNERNRTNKHDNQQYVGCKRGISSLKQQDVADYKKPEVGRGVANNTKIARTVGTETLKRTRMIAKQSENSGDREAAEQYQSFMADQAMRTSTRIAQSPMNSAKIARDRSCRINKKVPNIRNIRDVKSNVRTIRKADNAARNAEKMTLEVTKSATEAGKQAVIATEKVVQAKKTEVTTRKAAEWIKKIVKGIIEGLKQVATILASASVPLLLILVIATVIAGIVASSFGIFFTEQASNEISLRDVIISINQNFSDQIAEITASSTYDDIEIRGSRASWADVLAIYAVDVTTNSSNPQDAATVTDEKIARLQEIFDDMNSFTSYVEEVTETEQVQDLDEEGNPVADDDGNPVMVDQEVVRTVLHIDITSVTAAVEAINLGFTEDQIAQVNALLSASTRTLWAQLLMGIGGGSQDLVNIALSQLGNEGGETYWRWAGLESRCSWCALFVSWCADQTGLMASGQVPFFSFCSDGVAWYQAKGAWIEGTSVNATNAEEIIYPGMIVFFDWADHAGRRDGVSDHVGIVTGVSGGIVYTVEGNNGDAVRESSYSVESESVIGFGIVE